MEPETGQCWETIQNSLEDEEKVQDREKYSVSCQRQFPTSMPSLHLHWVRPTIQQWWVDCGPSSAVL